MTDYDHFAPFYDAVMGNRGDIISVVERQIKHHHPTAESLLELGCGTGSVLAGLARHYQVHGIERSSEMLHIARSKLPTADLHLGSISGFRLDKRFDVIICVFDTINHLLSIQDWQGLFDSVHSHLTPGGLFIFDMNTTGRLNYLARAPAYRQSFSHGSSAVFEVRPVGFNLVEWYVTVDFISPTGSHQVVTERVQESAFPLNTVSDQLLSSSFTILETFDTFGSKPDDASDRIYFTCSKT